MDFIISANTDIGLRKKTNQDNLSVKTINTKQGKMVFAILCDGMGGLEKGEVASASVVQKFNSWVVNELPILSEKIIEDYDIRNQWETIAKEQNEQIKNYGAKQGVKLGTTVVVMLITQTRYYVMNIGDSRAYEISNCVKQLTKDHTFVAREVELGNMTPEQAESDERRSVLLQCIGASENVYPDMFFGDVNNNAVYMLCSDGFRHEITTDEMYECFNPYVLNNNNVMNENAIRLIELNKQRMEQDNISVILIRTF